MKIVKCLVILALMMISLIILSTKIQAVNVEENQNVIEEKQEYILEQEITLKVIPVINSIDKATISGNIKVLEIINDWCRIENDVETGWARINKVKLALAPKTEETTEEPDEQVEQNDSNSEEQQQEEPENNDEEESNIPKVGYVDAEGLIVRAEPTTESEELDSLSRNDELDIIGKEGNWYKINLKGQIGYVSAKYVSETRVPETTSRSGSTLRKAESEIKNQQEDVQQANNTETSNSTGNEVVEYAKQFLGCKYISGGTSPATGFDCSGFTVYVYKNFGISLNRTSRDQINNGVPVERNNLQQGDLVLFKGGTGSAVGHVGIYIGGNNFIHASNPSDGVKITSLSSSYYDKRYVGARRVI